MPYVVRKGDPLPWFQGTNAALGGLLQLAMMEKQGAQRQALDAASQNRAAAIGQVRDQRQQDFTRERDAANQAFTTQRDTLQRGQQLADRAGEVARANEKQREADAKDAAEASALQGLMGVGQGAPTDETPGPPTSPAELGAGFGPAVTLRKPASVLAVDAHRATQARDAAAQADRDERIRMARERLDLDTQRLEIMAQKNGGRIPEAQWPAIRDSLMRTYGFTEQQAQDHRNLVESKMEATSQVKPEANHVERDAARKRVDALRDVWERAAGSTRSKDKGTAAEKKAAYDAAEAEFLQKYGPGTTRPAAPAGATPGDDELRKVDAQIEELMARLRQREGNPRP